uniref:Uncharacterized protein n=1 Tax=Anguilla anguilla TaxID=7936 RepID=A0A0E9T6C0_ANGAN
MAGWWSQVVAQRRNEGKGFEVLAV